MKKVKNNIKVIVAFILGVVLSSTIAVYAVINASEIDYKNGKKVSQALDDLYSKIPSGTIPITTKENQIDVSQYQYADTTGLYTADEYNSKTGEGINYNSGVFTTTSKGIIDINVGFIPSKIYVRQSANDAIQFFDSSKNASKTYHLGFDRQGAGVAGNGSFVEFELNDLTSEMTHIVTIDAIVKFRANQITTYSWLAVK